MEMHQNAGFLMLKKSLDQDGTIPEGMALLLLSAEAGADGAEKSIAGASGGLPAARCSSCDRHR